MPPPQKNDRRNPALTPEQQAAADKAAADKAAADKAIADKAAADKKIAEQNAAAVARLASETGAADLANLGLDTPSPDPTPAASGINWPMVGLIALAAGAAIFGALKHFKKI